MDAKETVPWCPPQLLGRRPVIFAVRGVKPSTGRGRTSGSTDGCQRTGAVQVRYLERRTPRAPTARDERRNPRMSVPGGLRIRCRQRPWRAASAPESVCGKSVHRGSTGVEPVWYAAPPPFETETTRAAQSSAQRRMVDRGCSEARPATSGPSSYVVYGWRVLPTGLRSAAVITAPAAVACVSAIASSDCCMRRRDGTGEPSSQRMRVPARYTRRTACSRQKENNEEA